MRTRFWLPLAALCLLLPLTGCAKLNEWLEGTVGDEVDADAVDPEQVLADAKAALEGDDPAPRAGAIPTLLGLNRPDALEVVLQYLDDADPAVGMAVLNGLQGLTGFPEKTEDERQLDPEGYQQQLDFKQQVVEQGVQKLIKALDADDSRRYGAMIVMYNLAQAPVVPENARELLTQGTSATLTTVAGDASNPTDVRLLAIELLVNYEAAEGIGSLAKLLSDPDELIRGRVALALGQMAGRLAGAEDTARAQLLELIGNKNEPVDVRWRAAAALGALGSSQGGALLQPIADDAGIDAYRAFALANCTAADAQAAVTQLNTETDQIATAAEEELALERKKGYR